MGRSRAQPESQAIDATLGHAQADHPPTAEEVAEIVEFENRVFTAQILDKQAKWLNEPGATGGPVAISEKTPLDLAGLFAESPPPFTPFKEYDAWAANSNAKRATIKRGQDIFNTRAFIVFNTRTFIVTKVAGVNAAVNDPDTPFDDTAPLPAQCSTCHNQTAGGADVLPASLRDIGVGGQSGLGGQPTSDDLPVLKLTCKPGKQPHAFSGPVVITNDPGRALITGKCVQHGQRTVPPLRALASRAPYFSNGSAKDLLAVVNFYNTRFNIGLTSPRRPTSPTSWAPSRAHPAGPSLRLGPVPTAAVRPRPGSQAWPGPMLFGVHARRCRPVRGACRLQQQSLRAGRGRPP